MTKTHIYENRTPKSVTVILPTDDNKSASTFTFGPFGRMELHYPGLDQYTPHMLTKIHHETGLILLRSEEDLTLESEPAPEVVEMKLPETTVNDTIVTSEPAADIVVEEEVELPVEEDSSEPETVKETETDQKSSATKKKDKKKDKKS